jgi:triacylglycerol lipase
MPLTRTILAASLSAAALAAGAAPALADTPPPPGANVACQPTAERPEPVVLVHGTSGNMTNSWQRLSPALKAAGYCVYALNYGSHNRSGGAGVYGLGPIEDSAAQLAARVDAILAETGAAKVDVVGHSQGGTMPRHYVKSLGGGTKVDDLVGLAPSNHGTSNAFARWAEWGCPACAQQAAGSAFLTALNAGDETPGTADYTAIITRYDEVVSPPTSGFLAADGNAVTNVVLQDVCPADTTEHLGMPYDAAVIALTLNALGRSGPADPAYRPPCLPA